MHLVGYFHNCITMHGFMNVETFFFLIYQLKEGELSYTRNWAQNKKCAVHTVH